MATVTTSAAANSQQQYRAYLILSNIGKKQNVKELLVSAAAFGVSDVLVVGMLKLDIHLVASRAFSGRPHPFALHRFDSLDECCSFVKAKGEVSIVGVEIMDGAADVNSHPFKGNTAFLMGNEGTGLNDKQIEACDQLVYILLILSVYVQYK